MFFQQSYIKNILIPPPRPWVRRFVGTCLGTNARVISDRPTFLEIEICDSIAELTGSTYSEERFNKIALHKPL